MKAHTGIILAAGEGTRLKKYTEHLPKGMLEFAGKSLIERQIENYRAVGIEQIVIVKGFAQEKITFPGVTYYVNEHFGKTNMVASLFCAEEKLQGEVIISYADILFETSLLRTIMESEHDITACVDMQWERYWNMRYRSIGIDTESLQMNGELIVSLGKEDPPLEEIDGRYVGLLKFSSTGVEHLKHIWHKFKDTYWDTPWQVSGKPLSKAYMTDMLQAAIDQGYKVHALKCKNGWIEFDTNEDYEKALTWYKDGTLRELINL